MYIEVPVSRNRSRVINFVTGVSAFEDGEQPNTTNCRMVNGEQVVVYLPRQTIEDALSILKIRKTSLMPPPEETAAEGREVEALANTPPAESTHTSPSADPLGI